jgi:integrase
MSLVHYRVISDREEVDLVNGVLYIKYQAQQLPGQGMIIKEPKTESSKRSIELPGKVLVCLKTLYAAGPKTGLVFQTSNGTPFSQRNLLRHFHATLEKAGLPKVTFHSLRHFTATSLLQQGVHPKLVQSLLGHSTISLTMDTYSHVIKGMGKEAADKMNDLLQ